MAESKRWLFTGLDYNHWTALQRFDFEGLTHLGGCGIAGKEGNLYQHCWAHPTNNRLGSLARDGRI